MSLTARNLAKSESSRSGFTLIEIMIVLSIIGAILAIAGPRLFDRGAKIKSEVRKLSVLSREIRNAARLHNSTFRLVVSMKEGKQHSFWVESAPGNVTLLTEEQEKEQEKLTSQQREDDKATKKKGFSADARVMKKPETLPDGLFFKDIEFTNRSQPVQAGVTYIHYFPQGLVEEAVIHLTDKKTLNWTIFISPLTGKTEIIDGNISLKELKKQ